MAGEINIEIEKQTPLCVVHVEGEFAQLNVYPLKTQVALAMEKGNRYVILDLSGMSFIDSAGFGAILTMRSDCHRAGGQLLLVKPKSRRAQQVLATSSLVEVIAIHPDVDSAVTDLREKHGVAGIASHPSVANTPSISGAGDSSLGLESSGIIVDRLDKIENRLERIERLLVARFGPGQS